MRTRGTGYSTMILVRFLPSTSKKNRIRGLTRLEEEEFGDVVSISNDLLTPTLTTWPLFSCAGQLGICLTFCPSAYNTVLCAIECTVLVRMDHNKKNQITIQSSAINTPAQYFSHLSRRTTTMFSRNHVHRIAQCCVLAMMCSVWMECADHLVDKAVESNGKRHG